jgi:ATP-dependent RNA helicase DeaD
VSDSAGQAEISAAEAVISHFEDLGLSETTLAALQKAEYLEPTPIQAGLIPRALAGVDVLGQARTGTGKTAAFVIPILEGLAPRKEAQGPQALILVPTRELAVQVDGEVHKLSYGRKVHSVALYGGKPIRGQIDKLHKGADIVVGTPGRVLDHLARGTLELRALKFVVLDEADRMLDIGFRPDIEKILRKCPQSRQTLLLSATVPPPVERLAQRYMRDPESLNFSPGEQTVDTIEQFYFTVDPERKFDLLVALLKREQPRQAIIFCRTKRGTDKVFRGLSRKFKGIDCIHGDLQQNNRDRVMQAFRDNKVRCLVATDVVGRGIDVSNVSHIINFDIPQFSDDYVHRVGRTGRMGREGIAFTFVTPEEGGELTRIEIRIERLLERDEIEGFEAFTRKAMPQGLPVEMLGPAGVRTEDGNGAQSGGDTRVAEEEPVKPKPAPFGGRTRRIRRAL